MKRTLAVLALTGSLAMLSGGAAMATTYPAAPPGVTVSDGAVTPGEAFTFSGTGFTPGEQINVTVTDTETSGTGAPVGSRSVAMKISLPTEVATLETTADAQGAFSLPITLDEAGVYTITAVGETSGRTQSAMVTVAEEKMVTTTTANDAETGGLADTGADSDLLLWGGIGAAALIVGATSVVIVRRRANLEETA